jgi:hypothetical protein
MSQAGVICPGKPSIEHVRKHMGLRTRNIPSAIAFFHIITEKYPVNLTKNRQQYDNTISTAPNWVPFSPG